MESCFPCSTEKRDQSHLFDAISRQRFYLSLLRSHHHNSQRDWNWNCRKKITVKKFSTINTIIFNRKFSVSPYQSVLYGYWAQYFVSNCALLIVMIWINLRWVKQYTTLRSDVMCQYGQTYEIEIYVVVKL